MYGAVRATSRRLGVRQLPLGMVAGSAITYFARESSCGLSLHIEVRRYGCAFSLAIPSNDPNGTQLFGVTQSQTPPCGQSSMVGMPSPVWGMPMLYELSSVKSGVLWQSLQPALPTNSRAPSLAAGEIIVESPPCPLRRSTTNLSNALLRLIRIASNEAIALA